MNERLFMVTVKQPRDPEHNPHHKKTGRCTAIGSAGATCTDTTGQHHTVLVRAITLDLVRKWAAERWEHVTRIEEAAVIHQATW